MRAADGRGPATILSERFQAELGAASASALIDRVYAAEMSREKLASLAKVVFTAREDATAGEILGSAARDLAEMVSVLAQRLGFADGHYSLALTGGVILSQEAYREGVFKQLGLVKAAPAATALVPEPVCGAVALARKAAIDQISR
jgi:N-acetylglucosamine kinase-like BadF-type ATPase